jgi:hypothetical protein
MSAGWLHGDNYGGAKIENLVQGGPALAMASTTPGVGRDWGPEGFGLYVPQATGTRGASVATYPGVEHDDESYSVAFYCQWLTAPSTINYPFAKSGPTTANVRMDENFFYFGFGGTSANAHRYPVAGEFCHVVCVVDRVNEFHTIYFNGVRGAVRDDTGLGSVVDTAALHAPSVGTTVTEQFYYYFVYLKGLAIDDAQAKQWAADPWGPFRPRRRHLGLVPAGAPAGPIPMALDHYRRRRVA